MESICQLKCFFLLLGSVMSNITLIYDITDIRCLAGCVDNVCITSAAVKLIFNVYNVWRPKYLA